MEAPFAHAARPRYRSLRIDAFDPHLDVPLSAAANNCITVRLPWDGNLQPGPIGEHVEVIDYDPESQCFYSPVDLNSPSLLIEDGLSPAEGIPQFHQQMVYALAMGTVRHFEQALGRAVLWSAISRTGEGRVNEMPVLRLRIYPHAIRQATAFYSPSKKAVLFGYCTKSAGRVEDPAQSTRFSCLSQSLVVHETAHAILDGMKRLVTPENSSVRAMGLQEGFCDFVALMQQFASPGTLKLLMGFTSDLDENDRRLCGVAKTLAQPIGLMSQSRARIGPQTVDQPETPWKADDIASHAANLVSALFDAFLTINRERSAAVLKIAGMRTSHTDVAEPLLDAVVDALCAAAVKSACHILRMCIRGTDYCPAVDATAGDFLRALITADYDVHGEDPRNYHLAILESFRRRGIYPDGVRALSPLNVLWPDATMELPWNPLLQKDLTSSNERLEETDNEQRRRRLLHDLWFFGPETRLSRDTLRTMGLATSQEAPQTIARADEPLPRIKVQACRLARRIGTDGEQLLDWVILISQTRPGYFDPDMQKAQEAGAPLGAADFLFRGGCTLIVDAQSGRPRFCIAKDILSPARLEECRQGILQSRSLMNGVEGDQQAGTNEPLAPLRSNPLSVDGRLPK